MILKHSCSVILKHLKTCSVILKHLKLFSCEDLRHAGAFRPDPRHNFGRNSSNSFAMDSIATRIVDGHRRRSPLCETAAKHSRKICGENGHQETLIEKNELFAFVLEEVNTNHFFKVDANGFNFAL